jgi:hypothetical protein
LWYHEIREIARFLDANSKNVDLCNFAAMIILFINWQPCQRSLSVLFLVACSISRSCFLVKHKGGVL